MPSRHPHNIKTVYIPFKEDAINAILALITPKLKEIQQNPKARGFKDQMKLHSTLRNTFRKAKEGLMAVRQTGSPITSIEDWERIATAMKIVYHQGEQAGLPEEDYLRVSEAVRDWVEAHKYDPSAPEEQARRIQIRNKAPQKAISLATFPVNEILPLVQMVNDKKDAAKVELAGQMVNVCSKRLQNFKTHGVQCVTCGLKGEYFSLEYLEGDNHGKEHPHLNLYGVEDGIPVLMTHDHINPLSNGGEDNNDNMQTMCSPCNGVKGSRHIK